MRAVPSNNHTSARWRLGRLFAVAMAVVISPSLILRATPFEDSKQVPPHILLKVPFFSDKTDQCGPATLAAVLSFWGKPTNTEALRRDMYIAKLHGTLPMDLIRTAQSYGLKTDMIHGDLDRLRSELMAGRPVLAMLNMGYAILPVDHYVVVTGFDDTRGTLRMHSAGTANQTISYKKFQCAWEKADYWAMTARLP